MDLFGEPITVTLSPDALAAIRSVGDAIKGVGASAKASLSDLKAGADMVQNFAAAAAAAAREAARLVGEQARLDRLTEASGLSFQTAAVAAGRYVETIDLATAAARLNAVQAGVTQEGINALATAAGHFAAREGVTMAQAVERLTQGLANGETEGLRPFGRALTSLSGDSHTAAERMRALVETTRGMAPAASDAADQMARLDGEVERFKRETAAGFAETFMDSLERANRSVDGMATNTNRATTSWREFGQELGRVGAVALELGRTLTSLIGIGMATSVLPVAMMPGPAGAFARSSLERATDNFSADVTRLSAAWSALGAGGAPPSRGATGTGETPLGTLGEGSQWEGMTDPRAANAALAQLRSRLQPENDNASGGSRAATAAGQDALSRAADGLLGRIIARARGLAEDVGQSLRDREIDAEMSQRRSGVLRGADRGTMARMAGAKADQNERDERDREIARERSFSDQLEEQFSRRVTLAQEMADGVRSAYDQMAGGARSAYAAIVEGGDELGVTLRKILSQTLLAIGQEATVKALLNTAEGIAAIATYRYDAAASHFAAAGTYAAVAALAGIGASAAAPAGKSPASGDQRAAPVSDRQRASGASGQGTVVNVNVSGFVVGSAGEVARQLTNVLRLGYDQAGVTIPQRAVG